KKVQHWKEEDPLFVAEAVEDQLDSIYSPVVQLKSGGYLVINQTEALVAIDVNSGSYRGDDDAEKNAFQVNMRAAEEIARQIRLRDLGGVIVNDFIDMRDERHRRKVEAKLRDCVARDRARTKVLRISPFGLIEMTRQRIRPSLKRSIYEDCPCCNGTGHVKTVESMAIEVMRALMTASSLPKVKSVKLELHQRVADYLINKKRREITNLEEENDVNVSVQTGINVGPTHLKVSCADENGASVAAPALAKN
ncbi:MAG: ribonuclease E/G, partial [Planctomycetaceae bacterium]|nr:ribonuclease E/G [Planctomycetaceae bacterium]